MSRAHVANSVRLLNLPQAARDYLMAGQLTAGHARAILSAADPDALAELVVSRGLSVRATEELARKAGATPPKKPAAPKGAKDPDTLALESELSEMLGLAVELVVQGGAGELRIKYQTLEQLDEVCRKLNRA